jgi:mediator of RNA polymerase II transcription subunit 16
MRSLFIKEIMKMMHRNLDISMQENNRQQMLAIREQLVPKAISALFVLGVKPGTMQKNYAGKFAYAFLNLRLVATALAQLMSSPNSLNRIETLTSLRGLIKWGSEMLIYVADAIVRFKHDPASGISAAQALTNFAFEQDSPVVQLLLFTFSRVFLRFVAACVPKFLAGVSRALPLVRSVSERQQLMEMLEMGNSMPFKYPAFEAVMNSVETGVRNAYAQGAVSADRRSEIELSLCCDPTIPAELESAVQSVIDTSIPKLRENADLGRIYFWDTSWLGVEPSEHSRQYDVIRKIPLTKGMKLRICRRCGALMEDVPPEQVKESAAWFVHLQRYCVCANYWILE